MQLTQMLQPDQCNPYLVGYTQQSKETFGEHRECHN